jgi:hypothetical protein
VQEGPSRRGYARAIGQGKRESARADEVQLRTRIYGESPVELRVIAELKHGSSDAAGSNTRGFLGIAPTAFAFATDH